MVKEGAGGDIEDGLGADGLRCMHLGRPGRTRYSAGVLKGKQSLRT